MKAFFYLIVMSVLFSSTAFASDLDNITLTDFSSNKVINLSNFDNTKPTYIKLWATWCQPCMEQMPHFQRINEKYSDKVNILAVNININENTKFIDDVIAKFGLTMPVLLDNEGKLSEALGLVGTPFSVLINTNHQIVYTTHDSNNILDSFIDRLAKGEKLTSEGGKALTAKEKKNIILPWQKGNHTLFFTATWCDWYLKDSRPEMANACEKIQSNISQFYEQSENKQWHGFVNHLWTDQKALSDFITLYDISLPVDIDNGGVLFTHFNIRSIPTIIKNNNGQVIERLTGDEILTLKAE